MTAALCLMWKEYRVLRGFWLALAIFGLGCDGLIFLFVANPQDRLPGLFALVVVLPACFALGAGATLFALEREESTRDLLQYLPLTSLRIFASKVSVALSGTLLLTLVLLAVGLAGVWFAFGNATGSQLAQEGELISTVQVAFVCTIMVLEAMGWSVFFSLQSARPLLAAILGALGAIACVGLVQFIAQRLGWFEPQRSFIGPLAHLAMATAIWLIDVRLGSTWLHGRRLTGTRREKAAVAPTPLKRLFWQEWRGSRRLLTVLFVLGLLLPLVQWTDPTFTGAGVVPAVGLVLALFGSCTFLGDQERSQYRFFAERGVSGRAIWFSRLSFWTAAAALLAAALLVAHLLMIPLGVPHLSASVNSASWGYAQFALSWFAINLGPPGTQPHYWTIHWLTGLPAYVVWLSLAFGAGQLCSMYFRSGLLAAVFGVILAGMLLAWATLMHVLSIAWSWSVAPLAVALFAATLLRSDRWVLDRRRFSAWLPSVLVLAVPAIIVLTTVPMYRVFEVPNVHADQLQPQTQPVASAEATDAVRRVFGMCERLPLPHVQTLQALGDGFPAWLTENQGALDAVIEALSRLPADAAGENISPASATTWRLISAILMRYGRLAERGGKLDEAWTRYHAAIDLACLVRRDSNVLGDEMERAVLLQLTRWGAKEGQTAERLRVAVDIIQQLEAREEPLADHVWREYRGNLLRLDELRAQPDPTDAMYSFAAKWAPWEFARARRLLRYVASMDIQDARAADPAFAGGTILRMASLHSDRARAGFLAQTTLLRPPSIINGVIEARRLTLWYRRATRLALAAESWQLEHGRLPEKLDELAQQFGAPRPDPYTNQPFLWFPLGLRASARSKNLGIIPPKTPFLYGPAMPSIRPSELERLESLRCRSVHDSIWRADESIQVEVGAMSSPIAAGMGMNPMPAAGPPTASRTIVVDSTFTDLAGLALPISDDEDESPERP